jgi:hypothetical protein
MSKEPINESILIIKKYFIQGLSVAPWNAADGQTHISICGNPWIQWKAISPQG